MSFTSRVLEIVASALRSPAARRAARDLAHAAAEQLTPDQHGEAGTTQPHRPQQSERRGRTGAAHRPTAHADRGSERATGSGALRDRPSHPAIALAYAPVDDDLADPGEIVWAWVAFEEDITQGKDRPVLVIAREDARTGGRDGSGQVLIALMLTSHDRGSGTHVDEHGSTWVDIGTGAWDRQGRASEVRADRLLRIPIDAVRRDGSRLDRAHFDAVARATASVHGWDR